MVHPDFFCDPSPHDRKLIFKWLSSDRLVIIRNVFYVLGRLSYLLVLVAVGCKLASFNVVN